LHSVVKMCAYYMNQSKAAVKIQSLFRGHKVRKPFRKMPNLLAFEIIKKLPHAKKALLVHPSRYNPSQRHIAHNLVKNKIKPPNPYLRRLLRTSDLMWQEGFMKENLWKNRAFKNQKNHILLLLRNVPNSNKLTNENIKNLIRNVLLIRRKAL